MSIISQKQYNYHREPLFKECKILTIKDHYKLNVVTFMHQLNTKIINDLKYCITPDRPIRQAHRNMAKQHRALTTFSSLLPFHKFPLIWNELPH